MAMRIPLVIRVILQTVIALVLAEKDYIIRVAPILNAKNSLCDASGLRITRFNKSMSMLNGTYIIKQNLPNSSLVNFIANEQQADGKFMESGIGTRKNIPMCEFIKTDKTYQDISKSGNIPKSCPVKKGIYRIRRYMLDESSLPDRIPLKDRWRFDIIVKDGERQVCKHIVRLLLDRSKKNQG
ncbi:uncharacterized protein [Anabrus simplex]|uniref:uncharacterized protein n=1 Tax=Anabrus simplex TaxID=316456 RepID=UPI0035A28869